MIPTTIPPVTVATADPATSSLFFQPDPPLPAFHDVLINLFFDPFAVAAQAGGVHLVSGRMRERLKRPDWWFGESSSFPAAGETALTKKRHRLESLKCVLPKEKFPKSSSRNSEKRCASRPWYEELEELSGRRSATISRVIWPYRQLSNFRYVCCVPLARGTTA